MKRVVPVLVLLVLGCLFAQPAVPPPASAETAVQPKLVPWLTINVKDFGAIVVELFPDVAPLNVKNVETLATKGFYNGLIFHRIVPGFVIQGGDPTGTGMGGPEYTVPAEIKLNHVRGGFAMARTNNPAKASSSCQFYINLNDLPMLDGNYTVIGQVRAGMDVVDKIAAVDRDPGDKPINPVVMNKVIVEMKPPSAKPTVIPLVHFMNIAFKDYGNVRVQLFPMDAPRSVASIESLVGIQFYDGVPLKEIFPGAWIQGGDRNTAPDGSGCQGCCQQVPSEFKRHNLRGAVGIGTASSKARATRACEFYFCVADQPGLDSAGYAVIGQVVDGMDVLDKIAKVKLNSKHQPTKPVIMEAVTIEKVRASQE
jgi:peptidyl-prolyl cis-trans isomerase B (cyclophilin B)